MPDFTCLFGGKYLLENAGNCISEPLDFKNVGGACPRAPLEACVVHTHNHSRLLFPVSPLLQKLLIVLSVSPGVGGGLL